jgi:hypothetical protein
VDIKLSCQLCLLVSTVSSHDLCSSPGDSETRLNDLPTDKPEINRDDLQFPYSVKLGRFSNRGIGFNFVHGYDPTDSAESRLIRLRALYQENVCAASESLSFTILCFLLHCHKGFRHGEH